MRARNTSYWWFGALSVLLFFGCGGGETAKKGPSEDAGPDVQAPAEDTFGESADVVTPLADPGPTPTDEGTTGETMAPDVPVEPPGPELCADGLGVVAFDEGEGGKLRHQLAADFSITRADGVPWTLSEKWTGCETYVFIPDTIPNTQGDGKSIWERDVLALIQASPPNVHYFFVSRMPSDAAADAATGAMLERVAAAVQKIEQPASDEWWFRLHVVQGRAMTMGGWLSPVLSNGIGQIGFAIDRFQRIRGIGSFADVNRYDPVLAGQDQWPWEANLAYAAHEARFMNAQAARMVARDALEATEIALFDGEVIEQLEDVDVELPSAEQMAGFDTFEIEVDMRCPNPALPEPGNCGAWDYLAHLWVYVASEEGEERVELGRFITTYHREAHWVHDVTPMMAHLLEGGPRKFRWEWAPEWNKQPTETRVTLRLASQGKGYTPSGVAWLWGGAGFNAGYNEKFPDLEVAIPADTVRAELYAVITGHGADTQQCAEFCNHQHEFTVEGETFLEQHPTVGSPTGCVDELENGMTPNQWGTWWFGRGGWCPGQAVAPFIVDVTDLVEPGGMATVGYRGQLGGQPPPDNAGNINMTSYLVFYH